MVMALERSRKTITKKTMEAGAIVAIARRLAKIEDLNYTEAEGDGVKWMEKDVYCRDGWMEVFMKLRFIYSACTKNS